VVAFVAPFIMTAGSAAFTIDTWWTLTMGRLMVAARRPLVDTVLSLAPAEPGSVHGQWLAHVLLYAAYALGAESGLRLFAGGIATLAFGLLVLAGQALGGTARTSALGALLAVFVAANNLGLRAQLFSYLLFAVVYLLLTLRHRHPRALFALPLVFALWANLHGAFLMGLLLVSLYAGDALLEALTAAFAASRGQAAVWREPGVLFAVLAASILAAACNPLGPGVYTYVWSIASYASSKTLIPEWQPTTIQDFGGQALAGASLLLVLVLWKSQRPVRRLDVLALLTFGSLALTSQRQVVWWGMLAGPILAGYAAALPRPGWLPDMQPPHPCEGEEPGAGVSSVPNWLLAGLLIVAALLAPVWRPALADRLDGGASAALSTPSGVAGAAATLPEGARMFVFQPWTGYFAWRLWPRQQSLMDARFETHPSWVWDEYQAVSTGRADWEQILARYDIEYLVLDTGQQFFLADRALKSGHWALLYQDNVGAILGRGHVDERGQRGSEFRD
jgi:hypothetical protein